MNQIPDFSEALISFETTIDMPLGTLPVRVMRLAPDDKGLLIGCRYVLGEPLHSRMIADHAFSDAERWALIRFLRIALFQASRGLSYFFFLRRRTGPAPAARRRSRGWRVVKPRAFAAGTDGRASRLIVSRQFTPGREVRHASDRRSQTRSRGGDRGNSLR